MTWLCVAMGLLAAFMLLRHWARSTSVGLQAAQGDLAKLERLLAANPNDANEQTLASGEQPIHLAAGAGRADSIAVLLKYRASPNARCEGGGTPLQMAAASDAVDALRCLIEAGADVDDCDDQGVTALHQAAAEGHRASVALLLDAGAQANLKEAARRTALDVAHDRDHTSVVELLASRGGVSGGQVRMKDLRPPKTAGGAHRVPQVLAMPLGHPRLLSACAEARASIDQLKGAVASGRRAWVKGRLRADSNEKVWIGVERIADEVAYGCLNSSPLEQPSQLGASTQVALSEIEDWVAERGDGKMSGGFGLQVLFAEVSEEYGALPPLFAEFASKLAASSPAS
jgi:uncharacterized protein YegJ (DUF2314 family)